jgi:ABC-2 type transport system permease protein
LRRDRHFMVQTLVVPIALCASMYLVNADQVPSVADTPAMLCALAFWMGALVLMGSAFNSITTEGAALWQLYTLPHTLESVLRQKAATWAVVAAVLTMAVLLMPVLFGSAVSLEFVGVGVIALLGVPLFAVTATALGVLGSNPSASDVRQRVRPGYMGLYTVLALLYVLSMYAGDISQRVSLIAVVAVLAVTLWQRASDCLPYMVDPTATPPSLVSASDGLIAVLLAYGLQGAAAIVLVFSGKLGDQGLFVVSASATTVVASMVVYYCLRRFGRGNMPTLVGSEVPRAVTWGLGCGVIAVGALIAYLYVAPGLSLSIPLLDLNGTVVPRWILWILTFLAPIGAEFIFRGLVFAGLRRSFGALTAGLASAAIFAFVQSEVLAVPAFALGLAAALAFHRTGALLAPVLTHLAYVVALLWFLTAGE